MQLDDFIVLHISKSQIQEAPSFLDTDIFFIDTCQRWVWVGNSDSLLSEIQKHHYPYDLFRGAEGYLFLLRLACGLESQIIGETDIFGQFKEYWRKFSLLESSLQIALTPWMNKLFEDTKKIRTQYLQNLGGSSYGTLVRKLIHEKTLSHETKKTSAKTRQKILILGAGQLAQSIAPFLLEYELFIWNRDPGKLDILIEGLTSRTKNRVTALKQRDELQEAWVNADHVILCIPPDPNSDGERIQCFSSEKRKGRLLIHLGILEENAVEWRDIAGFYSLSDLFKLQRELDYFRSAQAAEALKACEQKTNLRALASSDSTSCLKSEDLVLFA